MPFSPDEYEVKPDLSLDGFIRWAEQQDPTRTYDGESSVACVFCQWLTAETGQPVVYEAYTAAGRRGAYGHSDWDKRFDLSQWEMSVARPLPHTIGAALSRAKALRGS